jgi:hypothetical protein
VLNPVKRIRFGAGPIVSHRRLGRCGLPQLLGVYAPACLLTRLFTSSLNSASATPYSARLVSLTDRVRGPLRRFADSSDLFPLQGGDRVVRGMDFLLRYGLAPNMRPFDIRHPSRDAENRDSATLYKLYTQEGSKLSSSNSTFFRFGSHVFRFARCRTFPCFSFQTVSDERVSDLPNHLIDPRPRFFPASRDLGDTHGFKV